jgi:hypothetical protein
MRAVTWGQAALRNSPRLLSGRWTYGLNGLPTELKTIQQVTRVSGRGV